MHSTNYYNTFIEIAEDCKHDSGVIPPIKDEKKTIANLQFEILFEHPYKYSSDEVLFAVFARRKGFLQEELEEEKKHYFSKGQPCFRASPLSKSYGWGVHSNSDGKIAIYGVETDEYKNLLEDESIKKIKAMRSRKK